MPALHPMPDSACERPSGSSWGPWTTVPRSPTWDMAGASHEPQDPPYDVIDEALRAAHEELADAMLHGSEDEIEAAQARLERYQRVVDRYNSKEDDHPDEAFWEPEDDWDHVVWLDDEGGEHGA